MDNIINDSIFNATEDGQIITVILRRTTLIKCKFCNGEGHTASKCTTKRDLDRVFSKLNLKAQWGTLKSTFIKDSIQGAVTTRTQRKSLMTEATETARNTRQKEQLYNMELRKRDSMNG